MKAVLSAIIVCTGICCASAAFAVEPASAATGSSTTTSSPRNTGDAWRYRFYRDHWWYWLPTNRWAVYDNGRWLLPPEQTPAEAQSASPGKTTGAADSKQVRSLMEVNESAIAVGAEPAKHSAEFYLSAGGVFSRHAHEHAQVLERYAASGGTVPANVVRHQAEAIHHDVEHARKSFSRALSANAETNGETRAAIKELQTGLRSVAESVRRLEGLVHEQGAVQATLVKSETAIVSRLLQQTNEAANAAEERQRAEEEDRADID